MAFNWSRTVALGFNSISDVPVRTQRESVWCLFSTRLSYSIDKIILILLRVKLMSLGFHRRISYRCMPKKRVLDMVGWKCTTSLLAQNPAFLWSENGLCRGVRVVGDFLLLLRHPQCTVCQRIWYLYYELCLLLPMLYCFTRFVDTL